MLEDQSKHLKELEPIIPFKKHKIKKIAKIKNSSDYKNYLKSKHWYKRRKLYWEKHKRICFCCKHYADNLHHRSYANLYKEKDNDFVPLCKNCHKKVHILIKEKNIKLSIAHYCLINKNYK